MVSIDELSGARLGKYVVGTKIGEGSTSVVYHGTNTANQQDVAIKVISANHAKDSTLIPRFRREQDILRRLESHPNIISNIGGGAGDGFLYVVMPLMEGGSLRDRLESGQRYTTKEAVALLETVAGALNYAHQEGIVHRDIKPDNILFDANDVPYIADFGIAKLFNTDDTALTDAGVQLGTPRYMAPEQWRGSGVSPATDQYSLSAVMFYVLTGRPPFMGETAAQLMSKVLREPPPQAHLLVPEVGPHVATVLQKGLAKIAADRYPSLGAFVRAFSVATTTDRKPAAAPLSSNNLARYVPIALFAVLLLIGAVTVGLLLSRGGDNADEDAAPAATTVVSTIQSTSVAIVATTSSPSSTSTTAVDEIPTATSTAGATSTATTDFRPATSAAAATSTTNARATLTSEVIGTATPLPTSTSMPTENLYAIANGYEHIDGDSDGNLHADSIAQRNTDRRCVGASSKSDSYQHFDCNNRAI